MRKLFIYLCLAILWVGCEKEDALTPTGYERDWMVITKPTNGDVVDELRYEIYDKYGVSTYYNDTIGQEERTDILETPYTYYEILKVYYDPGYTKPDGHFRLLPDHLTLAPVLEHFRDEVFNKFAHPEDLAAFLFVDSLCGQGYGNKGRQYMQINTYIGFNTVVIRVDEDFGDRDESGKKAFSNRFLVEYMASKLMSGEQQEWSATFFQISRDMNPTNDYYVYSREYSIYKLEQMLAGTDFTEKEQLGIIISWEAEDSKGKKFEASPTEEMDMQAYVDAVLNKNITEFETQYADYEVVKKKFHLVREKIIEVFGFKLPE